MTRVVLVGEDNPYGEDPRYALYPDPPQSAGGRLCRGVLAMRERDYLRVFERRNLCASTWSLKEAREAAAQIAIGEEPPAVIVMLGAKVTNAFRSKIDNFQIEKRIEGCHEHLLARIPHTSGRNLMWNQHGMWQRTRDFLRSALPPDIAKWVGSGLGVRNHEEAF